MNLIKILIERKARIEKLEEEVDGLSKELEHLYFVRFNGEKTWKRSSTMLAYRIKKALYSQDIKSKGEKRVGQLEEKRQHLSDLISEVRECIPNQEVDSNIFKIG